MKLSRSMVYGIQATLLLAETDAGRPVPCSKLSTYGAMPERFLLQILRSLVNHGILVSARGVDGGYCLNCSPNNVTLLDIIEVFDNPLDPDLPMVPGLAPGVREKLIYTLQQTTHSARRELEKLTFADLREAIDPLTAFRWKTSLRSPSDSTLS